MATLETWEQRVQRLKAASRPEAVSTFDDVAAMLRELADEGWKPLLYFEDRGSNGTSASPSPPAQWVCYPQGEVRAWASFRAADPLTAVRGLYQHALQHPNVAPPPPPPAVPNAGSEPVVRPVEEPESSPGGWWCAAIATQFRHAFALPCAFLEVW